MLTEVTYYENRGYEKSKGFRVVFPSYFRNEVEEGIARAIPPHASCEADKQKSPVPAAKCFQRRGRIFLWLIPHRE